MIASFYFYFFFNFSISFIFISYSNFLKKSCQITFFVCFHFFSISFKIKKNLNIMNNIQNIENNNKIVNIFCFASKFFLFSFVFIVFFYLLSILYKKICLTCSRTSLSLSLSQKTRKTNVLGNLESKQQ